MNTVKDFRAYARRAVRSLGVTLLLANVGCGNVFQSVTALHRYETERPQPEVVKDRAQDVLATIDLVHYMLTEMPYAEGEGGWVEKLPLTEDKARAIRREISERPPYNHADLNDRPLEIPIVKIYRCHLAQVLSEGKDVNCTWLPPDQSLIAPPASPPPPPPPRPGQPQRPALPLHPSQQKRPAQSQPSPQPQPQPQPAAPPASHPHPRPPHVWHGPAFMLQDPFAPAPSSSGAPPPPPAPSSSGAPPSPPAPSSSGAPPSPPAPSSSGALPPPPPPPLAQPDQTAPTPAPIPTPTPIPAPPPQPPSIPALPSIPASVGPILDVLASAAGPIFKSHWEGFKKAEGEFLEAQTQVAYLERESAQYGGNVPGLAEAEARLAQAANRLKATQGDVVGGVDQLSVAALPSRATAENSLNIVSMALRADLEALAMAATIAYQSARVISTSRMSSSDAIAAVEAVAELEPQIKPAAEALDVDAKILRALVKQLVSDLGRDEDDIAKRLFPEESLVDNIQGIALDWIHVKANAGIDVMIFNPGSVDTTKSNNDGKTYDYTGRLRKAEYDIKPIVLANANLSIGLDSFNLPGAGAINLGYKTDRQWKSGGDIQSGSLGAQLGVDRRTSDLIDLGLQITGARSSVKIATFDAGNFKYENANTGAVLATAPFQVKYTQVDVGYDLAWLIRHPMINVFYAGFRFLDYRLPRLLYELENQAPSGSDNDQYTYFNEYAPQNTTSRYYLGGLEGEFDYNDRGTIVPYVLVGGYVGGGPVSFLKRRSKAVECAVGATTPSCVSNLDPADTDLVKDNSLAAVGALGAGLRWRFAYGTWFSFYGEASYRLDVTYSETSLGSTDATNGKEHVVDFGGPDLVHTIHAGLNLNL